MGVHYLEVGAIGGNFFAKLCMAERPEDLSLPASVVARIIKDAVSKINDQFRGTCMLNWVTVYEVEVHDPTTPRPSLEAERVIYMHNM